MPDAATLRAFYDARYFDGGRSDAGYASGYAHAARVAAPVYEEIHDLLLRQMGADIPRHVLDIGCAYGAFLDFMRERRWQVEGLDLSEAAIQFARQQLGLEAYAGSVGDYAMAYPHKRFGVITMLDVLEHLPDPVHDLRCVSRMLLPGGLLVAKVPYVDSLRVRVERENWRQFKPPEHLHFFCRESMRRMLDQVGMDVVSMRLAGGIGLGKPGAAAGARSLRSRVRSAVKPVALQLARWVGWMDMLLVVGVKRREHHD